MKSSTKGFLLGLVSGVGLTLVVIVGGFVALVLVGQAMMGGAMANATMPSPMMPAMDRLTVYGQTDYEWNLKTLDGEVVSLVQVVVEDSHAEVGHADLVGVGEAKREPGSNGRRVLADLVDLTSNVAGRSLDS